MMKGLHLSLFTSAAHLAALMTSVPAAKMVQIHLHPVRATNASYLWEPFMFKSGPKRPPEPLRLQPNCGGLEDGSKSKHCSLFCSLNILANSEAEALSSCRRGAQMRRWLAVAQQISLSSAEIRPLFWPWLSRSIAALNISSQFHR